MSRLVIAEKPSVGRAVSAVVGADKAQKGYIEGGGYIVSWCIGHLVGLKYPNDYGNGWEERWSFSQLPMLPEKWQFTVAENTKAQYNLLKKLMSRDDVTEIICATDADREGECIFRYVYNMVHCTKPVMRLWVSSLEESAIKSALAAMKPMSAYDNLFSAGFARAKADWLVGMNGSRLFSVRYGGKLNIGRVQTPTLAMIVKRDSDVDSFVKQKYFTADLNCGDFTLSSARIDDENAADTLVTSCNNSSVTITSVKREVKTEKPPKLYDLTTLQRDANKTYGYTAQQTLDYTQSLYEGKLVTYPRTDSQFLSDDMAQTAFEVEMACRAVFDLGGEYEPNFNAIINNSKVSGHHAIIPTVNIKTADISSLPSGEHNILKLITTRLICATAPNHKYESVIITAKCADTEFTASGKTVLEMGWKEFIKPDKKEEKTIPGVSKGQTFTANASKGEHFTSPPKAYTEDTLLSAMERAGSDDFDSDTEKKGLGTPATRAAVIESLVKNGYAKREGKNIRSTDKGKELISVVPDEVKSAKLTAEWEKNLHLIERGDYSADSFMGEISEFVTEMCRKYGSAVQSANLTEQGHKPLGKCPHCGGGVLNGKYGIYCKNKCGMNLTKVYGVHLSDEKVFDLLNGKQTSYTQNGRKTVVLPECVENPWNGKMYYQWKTEGKKMTNEQISEIAKIIGVSEDSISAMDENIKSDMVTALTEKNSDKTALYNELDRLWQKGSVYIGLAEIARNTGISLVTLHSLDLSTQQELVFEYMADSSRTENFYEVVNRELAVLEIERIARMVGMPVTRLRSLPQETQERICGMYAMEFDEDSTNAGLIENIRNIIEEAE